MNDEVTLTDCLMSGLAIFGLKYASLLRFDRDARRDELIRANLKSLYGIGRAPSDTALRERLDEVDPRSVSAEDVDSRLGVFAAVADRLARRPRNTPVEDSGG